MIEPAQVSSGIWRGASPDLIEDWELLQRMGIKYMLDLETGSRFLSDGSPLRETLMAQKYGIVSYAHPLGQILPPTQDELLLAVGLILNHAPIYVHCRAGHNRTGMVIAKLRTDDPHGAMVKSLAIREMKQRGMNLWYYWWSWFL